MELHNKIKNPICWCKKHYYGTKCPFAAVTKYDNINTCFINCEMCALKPNKGPHICRICKAENIHVTNDCPQNIKKCYK